MKSGLIISFKHNRNSKQELTVREKQMQRTCFFLKEHQCSCLFCFGLFNGSKQVQAVQKLNQRYPLWQKKTHRISSQEAEILSKLKRKKNTHLVIILKCSWFSSEWGTSRLLLRKVSLKITRLIFVFLQTTSSMYIFPIVA